MILMLLNPWKAVLVYTATKAVLKRLDRMETLKKH